MRLHVGCAMWNLRPWPFSGLRGYAEWCSAVEGNTTFYATPSRETVAGWAEQTGPDFRFVVKLPRPITHERRLADAGEPLRVFLDAVEPLGSRLHALWVQLPASFGPDDVPVLGRFLRTLPATSRSAVEVRHPGFFTDQRVAARLAEALRPTGTEWIPFDTSTFFAGLPTSEAERDAWAKKPRVPRRDTALTDHPIVRYLGRDDPGATVAGWQPWVEKVTGWLREGRSPTVFVHTPDNADAPRLARLFHDEVRARLPQLEPLPEPVPTTLF